VVLVAPDAGASKFVNHIGREFNINVAIALKYRPPLEEAVISEVIEGFSDKHIAITLNDMISTGGIIYNLVKILFEEKNTGDVYIGISHNLGLEKAHHCLLNLHQNFGLPEVIIINSIPQNRAFLELGFFHEVDISPILCQVIIRIH
jgi:ribose-phosphate pyrophosphokinase